MFNLAKIKPLFCHFLPSPRFWLKSWWGKPVVVLAVGIVLITGLLLLKPVVAGPSMAEEYLWPALAWILEAISSFLGQILLWIIDFLIQISSYNDFLKARVVSIGWSLIRDVANMFYILVMLIIAFGTMFKLEQYSWKKLLPRLILTAVLVNFSKTIIGLFIDFAQVIMLTFVNGYAAAAGGNFMSMFNIKQLFESTQTVKTEGIAFSALLGFLLGTIMLGVAVIVVGVFVLILLFRIITLWILIVLAPLAFLLGTFPTGQKYYAEWWEKLKNQIIVGPVIAFFLWLSLAALGGGDNQAQVNYVPGGAQKEVFQGETKIGTGTEAGDWGPMASFAVSIAMLFLALQMTQQLGVVGAGLASGAAGWMKSKATWAAKKAAIGAPKWGLKKGWEATEVARKPMWLALSRMPGMKMVAARRAGAIEAGRVARAEQKIKGVQYLPLKDQMRLAGTWKPILPVNRIAKSAMMEKMLGNPAFDTEARKQWGTEAPKKTTAILEDYKKLAGTDEKKLKQIFDFQKENPDLVHPIEERIRIVQKIKTDDITKVSAAAFNDDEVVRAMNREQRRRLMTKGSFEQRDNYERTLARIGGPPAGGLIPEQLVEAIAENRVGPEDIAQVQLSDELLDKVVSDYPLEVGVKIASVQPQAFDKKIKDIEARLAQNPAFKRAQLQEQIKELEDKRKQTDNQYNKRFQDLSVATGHAVPLKEAEEDKILKELADRDMVYSVEKGNKEGELAKIKSTPEDLTEKEKLEGRLVKFKVARISAATDSHQAFETAGYTSPQDEKDKEDRGNFKPGGEEAMVQAIQAPSGPPDWLKNLKVEAVVKKMPDGKIAGLTELGRVLVQKTPIERMSLIAQKALAAGNKDLAAALLAANKSEITQPNQKRRMDKKLDAPVFEEILEAVDSLEAEFKKTKP